MPTPSDITLYNKIKEDIYKKYPTHSAYRSGLIVKTYKEAFKKKYGNKEPYIGKEEKTSGLNRWFQEEWKNQRNEIGYTKEGDIYRPTKRITKETPKTLNELSKSEIKKAMKEKQTTGRVSKF